MGRLLLISILLCVSSCTNDSHLWEQGSPTEAPKRATIAEILRGDGAVSPSPSSMASELQAPVVDTDQNQPLDQPTPTSPNLSAEDLRITAFHGCYDGATCSFDLAGVPPVFGKNISVRLMEIDTPGIRAKCAVGRQKALQAKRFIEGMIGRGKDIRIVEPTRDKEFRLLARLYVDGADTGAKLVEAGLAVKHDNGRKAINWCSTSGR